MGNSVNTSSWLNNNKTKRQNNNKNSKKTKNKKTKQNNNNSKTTTNPRTTNKQTNQNKIKKEKKKKEKNMERTIAKDARKQELPPSPLQGSVVVCGLQCSARRALALRVRAWGPRYGLRSLGPQLGTDGAWACLSWALGASRCPVSR